MEPAPQRDTSNCTELSAVPFDQGQELSRSGTSTYTNIYLAPNGTANNTQTHLDLSNTVSAQVKNKQMYELMYIE